MMTSLMECGNCAAVFRAQEEEYEEGDVRERHCPICAAPVAPRWVREEDVSLEEEAY